MWIPEINFPNTLFIKLPVNAVHENISIILRKWDAFKYIFNQFYQMLVPVFTLPGTVLFTWVERDYWLIIDIAFLSECHEDFCYNLKKSQSAERWAVWYPSDICIVGAVKLVFHKHWKHGKKLTGSVQRKHHLSPISTDEVFILFLKQLCYL